MFRIRFFLWLKVYWICVTAHPNEGFLLLGTYLQFWGEIWLICRSYTWYSWRWGMVLGLVFWEYTIHELYQFILHLHRGLEFKVDPFPWEFLFGWILHPWIRLWSYPPQKLSHWFVFHPWTLKRWLSSIWAPCLHLKLEMSYY